MCRKVKKALSVTEYSKNKSEAYFSQGWTGSVDMANVFNRFFHSVFSPPDLLLPTNFTPQASANANCLSSIQLTSIEVAEVLQSKQGVRPDQDTQQTST